jgi:hypothetical protein
VSLYGVDEELRTKTLYVDDVIEPDAIEFRCVRCGADWTTFNRIFGY